MEAKIPIEAFGVCRAPVQGGYGWVEKLCAWLSVWTIGKSFVRMDGTLYSEVTYLKGIGKSMPEARNGLRLS